MINKPRDQQTPVSFRSLEVEAAIKDRIGSPSDSMGAVAKRDLERYYYLLRETLQTVSLSNDETIADVMRLAVDPQAWDESEVYASKWQDGGNGYEYRILF